MKISDMWWVGLGLILIPIVFIWRCLQSLLYGFCEPSMIDSEDITAEYLPYRLCFYLGSFINAVATVMFIIVGAIVTINLLF